MQEIYFETYGCVANYNSTEIMKGIVKNAGLEITNDLDYADIVVINSCIVKEPTEEKIRRKVEDLLKSGKKVILAGCMPSLYKEKLQKENLYLLETSQAKKIIDLIKDIKEKKYSEGKYLEKIKDEKVNLPKISKEKFIGIAQISEGCFGECSYCAVRLAKGPLYSYKREEIIKSIKKDIKAGCREIWITSQDNASYGNDYKKHDLPLLLKEILNIKGNFYLRVGMMNPNNVLEILDELVEIYKHPKMFKFLHLPIQSGSNKILKKMKRKYSSPDIKKIIDKFRKEIPEIMFSTDVIVGFPKETEKDFKDTLELVDYIKPEILNQSNFYTRNKTEAGKLKKLDPKIVKRRAKKLFNLHEKICKDLQKKYSSWKGNILINKKGFGNTYLGRMLNEYKLVAVNSKRKILGKIVNVKIEKITPHYLISKVIK
jgi:threonylcarbamoyladenosine tRNA methylthiotransferase CDKAL1